MYSCVTCKSSLVSQSTGSCFLSSHSICWMMRGISQHPHSVLLEGPEQLRAMWSQRSPQSHPNFGAAPAAAVTELTVLCAQVPKSHPQCCAWSMATKQPHKPQHKYLNSQTIPYQAVILPCICNARLNFGLQGIDFDWKPNCLLRCMGEQIWLRNLQSKLHSGLSVMVHFYMHSEYSLFNQCYSM